jgi:hypothetical protein
LAEELSYFVVQATFGTIHHFCTQCEPDLDDCVMIQEQCEYLNRVLQKLLHHRARYIDVDFSIDMRQFANFKIKPINPDAVEEQLDHHEELPDEGVLLTEQLLRENESILVISNTIDEYLNNLPRYYTNPEFWLHCSGVHG